MQDTAYGELHWQSPNVNAFYAAAEQRLHDAGAWFVLLIRRKTLPATLLMEERATIARELHRFAGAGTFLFTYSVNAF